MIIVYRYGLLAPTLNGDKVAEQMSAAHRYYNKLVEIERKLRAEISEALEPHETPAAKEIRAKMAELHQERRAIAERLKAQDASESATIPEDELNGLRHRLAKIEEEREALSKSLGKANKPLYELPSPMPFGGRGLGGSQIPSALCAEGCSLDRSGAGSARRVECGKCPQGTRKFWRSVFQ